jgi:hypothetical protein
MIAAKTLVEVGNRTRPFDRPIIKYLSEIDGPAVIAHDLFKQNPAVVGTYVYPVLLSDDIVFGSGAQTTKPHKSVVTDRTVANMRNNKIE